MKRRPHVSKDLFYEQNIVQYGDISIMVLGVFTWHALDPLVHLTICHWPITVTFHCFLTCSVSATIDRHFNFTLMTLIHSNMSLLPIFPELDWGTFSKFLLNCVITNFAPQEHNWEFTECAVERGLFASKI